MKGQKERILDHLIQGKVLTGLYATNQMRIMDYRKRISELRQDGYDIRDEMVYEHYKSGEQVGRLKAKYKRYWLEGVKEHG